MATTEGLTLATTEVKSGSGGFWLDWGGSVQSGLVGADISGGGGLDWGAIFPTETQPPRLRDRIKTKLSNKRANFGFGDIKDIIARS
jgi:hypothetical protein